MKKDGLIGVVLGNGPSRDLYDFSGDVVLACNIPGDGYSVDATIISDVEVVWLIANNPELITCPIIASTHAYNKMQELKIARQHVILDVFQPREWHTSAHYAAMYLSKIIDCDTVQIWGCDSYFYNDSTSYTDQFITTKSGDVFFTKWRETWNDIFRAYPDVLFDLKQL